MERKLVLICVFIASINAQFANYPLKIGSKANMEYAPNQIIDPYFPQYDPLTINEGSLPVFQGSGVSYNPLASQTWSAPVWDGQAGNSLVEIQPSNMEPGSQTVHLGNGFQGISVHPDIPYIPPDGSNTLGPMFDFHRQNVAPVEFNSFNSAGLQTESQFPPLDAQYWPDVLNGGNVGQEIIGGGGGASPGGQEILPTETLGQIGNELAPLDNTGSLLDKIKDLIGQSGGSGQGGADIGKGPTFDLSKILSASNSVDNVAFQQGNNVAPLIVVVPHNFLNKLGSNLKLDQLTAPEAISSVLAKTEAIGASNQVRASNNAADVINPVNDVRPADNSAVDAAPAEKPAADVLPLENPTFDILPVENQAPEVLPRENPTVEFIPEETPAEREPKPSGKWSYQRSRDYGKPRTTYKKTRYSYKKKSYQNSKPRKGGY